MTTKLQNLWNFFMKELDQEDREMFEKAAPTNKSKGRFMKSMLQKVEKDGYVPSEFIRALNKVDRMRDNVSRVPPHPFGWGPRGPPPAMVAASQGKEEGFDGSGIHGAGMFTDLWLEYIKRLDADEREDIKKRIPTKESRKRFVKSLLKKMDRGNYVPIEFTDAVYKVEKSSGDPRIQGKGMNSGSDALSFSKTLRTNREFTKSKVYL